MAVESFDYYKGGTEAGTIGARFGPEYTLRYQPARRNYLFAASEIEAEAKRRRALLREQLRRLAEQEEVSRRDLEGELGAKGLASSGLYLYELGLHARPFIWQKADILREMVDTEAQSIYEILKRRYGLSDEGINALLQTVQQRIGEYQSMF